MERIRESVHSENVYGGGRREGVYCAIVCMQEMWEDKKGADTMIITMDDREKLECDVVVAVLGDVEVKRLKVGDYVCEELGVCVERKTIDDFCGSLINGRLKKQIENMAHKYKYNYVLVSGKIKDRMSEINVHSVLGMMVSLIVKHKANIIMFDDDVQLVWAMRRLMERHEEMEKENA